MTRAEQQTSRSKDREQTNNHILKAVRHIT